MKYSLCSEDKDTVRFPELRLLGEPKSGIFYSSTLCYHHNDEQLFEK